MNPIPAVITGTILAVISYFILDPIQRRSWKKAEAYDRKRTRRRHCGCDQHQKPLRMTTGSYMAVDRTQALKKNWKRLKSLTLPKMRQRRPK